MITNEVSLTRLASLHIVSEETLTKLVFPNEVKLTKLVFWHIVSGGTLTRNAFTNEVRLTRNSLCKPN